MTALIWIMVSACTSFDPSLHVTHYERVAFRNAHVVDAARDTVQPNQTVYVSEGRISWVGPSSDEQVPTGTPLIDVEGAYLLPGLGDAHVHHYPAYDDAALLLYLVNGVTAVRVMDGGQADLEARRRIRAGELVGPRYFSCGPRLTYADGARDAADAASSVLAIAEAGFDCVKAYALRGEEETFTRILDVADSLGIQTTGHFHWALPLSLSLRLSSGEHIEAAGLQDFFGHSMPSADRHGAMARQIAESGIFVTPTISAIRPDYADPVLLQAMLDRQETRYIPDSLRDAVQNRPALDRSFEEFRAQHQRAGAITGFLHQHGVTIVLGTDAGGGLAVPGFSAHDELEALVEAGLTPSEALVAGTVNVATLLRTNGGRIEPGRDADFFLVSDNPLEDVSRARAIRGVFADHIWMDRRFSPLWDCRDRGPGPGGYREAGRSNAQVLDVAEEGPGKKNGPNHPNAPRS